MNIDLSRAPANQDDYDDYVNELIEELVENLKQDLKNAKNNRDLKNIIQKYDIYCLKNGKKYNPIKLVKNIKIKIINMAINEPMDHFDITFFESENKI